MKIFPHSLLAPTSKQTFHVLTTLFQSTSFAYFKYNHWSSALGLRFSVLLLLKKCSFNQAESFSYLNVQSSRFIIWYLDIVWHFKKKIMANCGKTTGKTAGSTKIVNFVYYSKQDLSSYSPTVPNHSHTPSHHLYLYHLLSHLSSKLTT